MKIAVDIRKIGQSATGDEVYVTNLVSELAKLDLQNSYFLCTNSAKAAGRAGKILSQLPPNFRITSLTPGGKLFWTHYSLPRFVKKEGIDLVHVQYIVPLRLDGRAKLITTIHDVSFERYPAYISFVDRVLLRYFIPRSVRRADRVIAVSKFTRDEIAAVYDVQKEKISAIYNGIDQKKYRPLKEFQAEFIERLRTKFGLPQRFLLHVSSLQPRKNVPSLIEAYRKYIYEKNDQETGLVIVGARGGHNYDKKIDGYLQDLILQRRVKLLGYVKDDELPALYAMAAAYVSPSSYEGFDLPVAEAMMSGIPVVASDIPCHREIMGSCGILTNVSEVDGFASALGDVLTDKQSRECAVREGQETARLFSWESAARETLALYQDVYGNGQ